MKKLFLCLVAPVALGACKKDEAPNVSVDVLTAKPWLVDNVALSTSGIPIPSGQIVTACQTDNTYKFNTDNTLLVDEGAAKCNASDPQIAHGTWAFANSDQTKITIKMPNTVFNGDFDIKSLSPSSMHLNTTQPLNGISLTIDATFIPK